MVDTPSRHDVVYRLTKIADASKREDGADIPLGSEIRAGIAEIECLRESNARWKRISQDNHAAFSAMRSHINEHVPMQSEEADLAGGPEFSISCAVVAVAVVAHVERLRTERDTAFLAGVKAGLEAAKAAIRENAGHIPAETVRK